jgi:glycosyltransferase involved in cell wall biosynthesis
MVELPPSRPIRIGFVLTELVGGGAERSMLSIIDALDRRRFSPTLILFDSRQDHAPPRDVPIVVLSGRAPTGVGRLASRVVQLARVVRRERLDLLVSFLIGPNIVSIAAARLAGIPVVIGERSAPRAVLSRNNRPLRARSIWSALVRLMYPLASRIVTNTEGARAELVAFLKIPVDRIAVIPNPIDLQRIASLAAEPLDGEDALPDGPTLVHVGRFTHAKDHDTLLNAFALVRRHRPATLVLVGDGEDEARVRALSSALGLDAHVVFTGFTRNPYRYLARATVSVLTSRFEGLPNVLIESMALGVPIVSTACQYGPLEILGDNEYGVLTPVGDAARFAAAVEALLDDPARRRELSERGRLRALDFDRTRVGPAYEDLFVRTARGGAAVPAIKSTRATST